MLALFGCSGVPTFRGAGGCMGSVCSNYCKLREAVTGDGVEEAAMPVLLLQSIDTQVLTQVRRAMEGPWKPPAVSAWV